MIQNTISTETARQIYDRLGAYYDWAERFESRAKARAMDLLDVSAGQRVLNVGVGTGKEHNQLQAAVGSKGIVVGIDISPVMLDLTKARTGAPVCQADARNLPFAKASFDGLFCSYVLDLIPSRDLPAILVEFRRILTPKGHMALVTLTEGVTLPSRILMAIWKRLYAVSPIALGGCRPIHVANLVRDAGFTLLSKEVVVQLGMPSEVLLALCQD